MSSANKVLELTSKDYIEKAKEKRKGNWNKLALVYFCNMSINLLLQAFMITSILAIFISGPLQLGYTTCILEVSRGEEMRVGDLLEGFNNKKRSILLWLVNSIFVFLWSLLLFFPGIIASYSYAMSFYILRDNPDLTQKEARERSIFMMRGYKWKLFCLQFRFIGWMLLSVLTLGILSIWIAPYMELATAEFYENIKNKIR